MNRELTKSEKALLLIFVIILIVVGYYKLIYEPVNSSISSYQNMAANEQIEVDSKNTKLEQMKAMQTAIDEAKASGDYKALPYYDNSKALLKELNDILSESIDYSVAKNGVSTADYVVMKNYSIAFETGNYESAREIINELLDSDNVLSISDISISEGDSATVSLNLTYYEVKQ